MKSVEWACLTGQFCRKYSTGKFYFLGVSLKWQLLFLGQDNFFWQSSLTGQFDFQNCPSGQISLYNKQGDNLQIYFVSHFETLSSRSVRLESCGFSDQKTFPALNIAPTVLNLEPFDEFETLHYFLKHYYLGLASNGVDFFDFHPERSVKNCLPHSEEGFLELR